ncbi:ABC transporter ATP-binding protein [Mucisphaera calidilacus]|uniref:Oligopeptide transport ATP-binding protein OppD n=1 Tax=Mucisphaera calidilacus TaxID=2527982 RepID=A0A518BVJ1_9BACT|nr:ABC transporter ATP-binding protein [Mucisphaera calidilacus]QDU71000.1 Oligopeptide transport ATP-binding protein OppD [Mucisphaera calidilacus]
MSEKNTLIEIEDLSVSFPGPPGGRRLQAADRVRLSIYPGQTLAVVGESGSGKSVSCLSILQLHPIPPARYDGGRISWRPDDTQAPVDLMTKSERAMRDIRGNQIAMIFQEPMTSLNPVYTIGSQIMEAILLHQDVTRQQAKEIAIRALSDVGIAGPEARLKEYPHQLSGGMRQRVMIAMALACQPKLLLADEPTTALDVTIQAQILELLKHLQHEHDMAILLITHDLGVVAESADVVAVMYAGRVVEYANVHALFERPLHPYTRGLLRSMPVLGANVDRLDTVMDGATVPEDFPAGYTVHAHEITPDPELGYGGPKVRLHEVEPEHWVLCEPDEGGGNPTFPRVGYVRAMTPAGE